MFCDIELLLRKRYYAHRSCSDIETDFRAFIPAALYTNNAMMYNQKQALSR